jgi:hypothetical protein
MDRTDVDGTAEGIPMLWLAAGLWLVAVCIVLTLALAVIDEFTRPPANVRRAGALLALVASFASLWLLLRPPSHPDGCPAPVMALSDTPTVAGCPSGWPNTIGGLAAAILAVAAVVVTRHRP